MELNIGICGHGFVGNAISSFFINKQGFNILIYDKYKNINRFEILLNTDMIFICLPTNFDQDIKNYNMMEIDSTIRLLNESSYDGLIIIKSTVIPDYCSKINQEYPKLKIISNPEFLSARTAVDDFANQMHIILGYTEFSKNSIDMIRDMYNSLFPKAKISVTTTEEASMVKLGCNSFYATKIQYFTELYLLCEKMKIDYMNVKNMMLMNGWINPMHTIVPGTDGKISFGGMCLPKDICALNEFMKKQDSSNLVLSGVIEDREKMRND
jgi:nucleotide sugar dehydrogenase